MLDKLNNITNLDYTIELDGTEYNITAADSLNADVARRVAKALHVIQSGYPVNPSKNLEDETIGTPEETKYDFDGHYAQSLSVVPSNGGTFTGPIAIPNVTSLNENNHYAINLGSVRGLVQNLAGFPTYIWNGTTLIEITEDNGLSLSPFKVILHNIDNAQKVAQDPPVSVCFKNEKNKRIDCWFLAINAYTGWTSLGRCFADGSNTKYYQLRVQKVDYAKTISQYHPTTDEPTNTGATNENRPFDHARLLGMENHLDNLGGNEESTDGKTVIEKIHIAITDINTKITNINNQITVLNNHKNDTGIHRRIVPGYDDASDAAFSSSTFNNEKSAAVIGDIYIKIES